MSAQIIHLISTAQQLHNAGSLSEAGSGRYLRMYFAVRHAESLKAPAPRKRRAEMTEEERDELDRDMERFE